MLGGDGGVLRLHLVIWSDQKVEGSISHRPMKETRPWEGATFRPVIVLVMTMETVAVGGVDLWVRRGWERAGVM